MKKSPRTFRKVFKDKNRLTKMLIDRYHGWTYVSLGIVYGLDHSSIYKACKVNGVLPPPQQISLSIPTILSLIGVKGRVEKNYKDYINDERRRKFPKLYRQTGTI